MENIYSFFILCFVFSPIFILSLENEYLFSARIPKLLPLFRIAFLNPIKEFKKISEKSYYSRYYNFAYNANYHSYDYYVRQNNWGYSKRIGYYNTLILANRIFEFRIWLSLRSIKNYEELKLKALLLLNEVNKEGLVFISSPLYSHPNGVKKGIIELRKVIIFYAEENKGLVFNQIPFLNLHLPYLKVDEKMNKFEEFYKPVLESSLVTKVVMTPGWEKSMGCKTEYEVANSNLKTIEYFSTKNNLFF